MNANFHKLTNVALEYLMPANVEVQKGWKKIWNISSFVA